MTGCKTIYKEVPAEIPTLDAIQPTRPKLKTGETGGITLEILAEDTIKLMTYCRQWEEYGRIVSEYIKTITCTD